MMAIARRGMTCKPRSNREKPANASNHPELRTFGQDDEFLVHYLS